MSVIVIKTIQEFCIHLFLINVYKTPEFCRYQFVDILPKNVMYSRTFDSEFLYIEVLIIDKSSQALDIDYRISITLVTIEEKMTRYIVKP